MQETGLTGKMQRNPAASTVRCFVRTLRCLRANVQQKDATWLEPTFISSRFSMLALSLPPPPLPQKKKNNTSLSVLCKSRLRLQMAKTQLESAKRGLLVQSGQGRSRQAPERPGVRPAHPAGTPFSLQLSEAGGILSFADRFCPTLAGKMTAVS